MKYALIALPLVAWTAAAVAQSGTDSVRSETAATSEMPPYTPDPGPRAGNWEATLTGTGQSSDDFDDSNFGMTGSLGYYFTKNFVLTFKQGLNYDDVGNSSLVNGRSIIQPAYQWDLKRWQPYLGLNVGAIYGAGVDDEAVFGPEGGVKYFVNESTFIFGSISYEMLVDECCSDGIIPYSVGIGFDF